MNNKCVTGDTLVNTDNGKIPVRNLVGKGFYVYVDGSYFRSTNEGFCSSGVKDIVKITLKCGSSIRVTKDHKLKTLDTNNIWIGAQHLKVGDKLEHQFNLDLDSKDWEIYNQLEYFTNPEYLISYDTIINIEEAGHEEVFDCTIQDTCKYVANGFVNHNCND